MRWPFQPYRHEHRFEPVDVSHPRGALFGASPPPVTIVLLRCIYDGALESQTLAGKWTIEQARGFTTSLRPGGETAVREVPGPGPDYPAGGAPCAICGQPTGTSHLVTCVYGGRVGERPILRGAGPGEVTEIEVPADGREHTFTVTGVPAQDGGIAVGETVTGKTGPPSATAERIYAAAHPADGDEPASPPGDPGADLTDALDQARAAESGPHGWSRSHP